MSFVKFTLGDIRTSVRRKLDDLTFDGDTIDEAANDFQFELFNDNRIRFMEASGTVTIALGSATSTDMPANFMNLIRADILYGAGQNQDITDYELDYKIFMQKFATYLTQPHGMPLQWTFFGDHMRFSRPSDNSYTINFDYMRSPALMVDAGDECELPINCRELMTLGTLERIMRVNEDYNESDFEFDRLKPLRTAFVRNYGRGSTSLKPMIIRSGRNRSRRIVEF
jgi:hypothetical protein